MKHRVKCRYGVEYELEAASRGGPVRRLLDLLTSCCCFVCHNRGGTEPRDEKIENCGNVCELFNSEKAPFCGTTKTNRKENDNGL